jgi:ABC-2 type transport system permease protein
VRLELDWQLAKLGWRRQTTYRAATLAGMFTNSVFGLVHGAILVAALHAAGRDIGGYNARDALTYAWLAQALIGPMAIFRWTEISERIRSGDIAIDFARPADVQQWWLFDDFGRAASAVVFRSIPQFLVGAVLFTLVYPSPPWRWLAVASSVALAILVSFTLRFLSNLAVFWTFDERGPMQVHALLLVGLSGMSVPLVFFPSWLGTPLRALPWAATVQTPVDVWLGNGNTAVLLALQAFWFVVLLAVGRVVLARAHRKLVVQGG